MAEELVNMNTGADAEVDKKKLKEERRRLKAEQKEQKKEAKQPVNQAFAEALAKLNLQEDDLRKE